MKVINRNSGLLPAIFENLFTENRLDVPNYENFRIPPVNISENLSNFNIELAVPGFSKENFSIEVENDLLKVSGESSQEESNDTEGTTFTRREFGYKSFTRTFNLPETVDVEQIDATYEAGVLKIKLPKKEEHKKLKRMVEIS
jgi:HSP20 family protein